MKTPQGNFPIFFASRNAVVVGGEGNAQNNACVLYNSTKLEVRRCIPKRQ